jgi:hypothetical protein
MSRVASIAAIVLGCTAAVGTVLAEEAPKNSPAAGKLLQAADAARQSKNYAECVSKAKEANGVAAKNAYDSFTINSLLMACYAGQNNVAEAVPYMEQVIDSPYQQAAAKLPILKYLMSNAYTSKNYEKAIAYGERVRSAGDTSEDTAVLIAQSYYLLGKYKEAMAGMDAIIARAEQAGKKPSEKGLNVVWSCAVKLKDQAAASRTVEKLILHYPKPEYWLNAMANILENREGNDDRIKLMTYRLMNEVGILKRGSDYRDMALIALDRGNPGEAQAVMEQAFAKNVYTDPKERESNQRLLESAKKKAVSDKASLANDEKQANAAATGDPLVELGGAYLGYGMPDKALAMLTAGIAKGKLKYPDEAYILLGIAQERSKNNAEAIKAFNKATMDPQYARLAKLWALEART